MGAAGYVTIYDREAVEAAYRELFPERSITDDWWYLDTITATLHGRSYILNYADDQGMHEGVENSFWFAVSEEEDGPPRTEHRTAIVMGSAKSAAQTRVHEALRKAGRLETVEVWT